MEDYMPEIQEEKKIEVPTELYKQITGKKVFKGTPNIIGDGSLLALKLAQQVLEKSIFVFSENNKVYISGFKTTIVTKNPAAAASGIARFHKDLKVVCFADAKTTKNTLHSVLAAAERNDNVIFICNNAEWMPKRCSFARMIKGQYSASASVGFPDDYILKLRRAQEKTGFKFLDVLSPQPEEWGFEASNTVSIARLASQSKLWPLYEIEDSTLKITKRPDIENVENYINSNKRTRVFSAEEISSMQKIVDKMWKQLNDSVVL